MSLDENSKFLLAPNSHLAPIPFFYYKNTMPKKITHDVTLTLRLPREYVTRLDKIADDEFDRRSATARRALELGLRKLKSFNNRKQ